MEKLNKIIKIIWTILNSRIFYIVMIILLVMFGLKKCSNEHNLRIDNDILEQNVSAYNDTIRLFKSKNGDLQAEKEIYIKSYKELKEENSDLYKRVKSQKGHIISLNRSIIKLKQDTSILHDSIRYLHSIIGQAVKIDSNTWMLPWELKYTWDKTNYDIFKGKTFVSVSNDGELKLKHDNTLLYYRESQIDVEFGEKVVDGKYNVFIKSAYPGFTPSALEGVFIDPNTNKDIKKLMKKDHWFTGFSVGISVTLGYDLVGQKPGLVVGPSLTYNIYNW